jgi:hypothetical protein
VVEARVVHVQLAPQRPRQVVVPVQRASHRPWLHSAVMPGLALQDAQPEPQALVSVADAQVPPHRLVPAAHAVATHAPAWQVVAVALAGQVAQRPSHTRDPDAQLAAWHTLPAQVKDVACAVGQLAHAEPHRWKAVLHVMAHDDPLHVAAPLGSVAQGVHELPQVTALVGTQPEPQRR